MVSRIGIYLVTFAKWFDCGNCGTYAWTCYSEMLEEENIINLTNAKIHWVAKQIKTLWFHALASIW